MKATVTLEFDLDDLEQREKYEELSGKALSNIKRAMHTFATDTLRQYRKYSIPLESIMKEIMTDHSIRTHTGEITHADVAHAMVEHIEKKFYAALEHYEAKIE